MPSPFGGYLGVFISEMKQFDSTTFLDAATSRSYYIKLGAVSDVLVRAFFKCIKTHAGYDSCERCVQH